MWLETACSAKTSPPVRDLNSMNDIAAKKSTPIRLAATAQVRQSANALPMIAG
jgi:hypothetical protein